jgi:hypothetical protein
MKYQVWVLSSSDWWKRTDHVDLAAVRAEVFQALKAGLAPLVTQEIPYQVDINFSEEAKIEAPQSETEHNSGPADPGDGAIRRGDATVTP